MKSSFLFCNLYSLIFSCRPNITVIWLPRHVGTCSCQLLKRNHFSAKKIHQLLRKNHLNSEKESSTSKKDSSTVESLCKYQLFTVVPAISFPIMTFRNEVCYTKSLCVFLFRQVKTLAIQIVFFLFTMAFITTH